MQIKRGSQNYDIHSSDVILQRGQPFYSFRENELFIGDGETELKDMFPVAGGRAHSDSQLNRFKNTNVFLLRECGCPHDVQQIDRASIKYIINTNAIARKYAIQAMNDGYARKIKSLKSKKESDRTDQEKALLETCEIAQNVLPSQHTYEGTTEYTPLLDCIKTYIRTILDPAFGIYENSETYNGKTYGYDTLDTTYYTWFVMQDIAIRLWGECTTIIVDGVFYINRTIQLGRMLTIEGATRYYPTEYGRYSLILDLTVLEQSAAQPEIIDLFRLEKISGKSCSQIVLRDFCMKTPLGNPFEACRNGVDGYKYDSQNNKIDNYKKQNIHYGSGISIYSSCQDIIIDHMQIDRFRYGIYKWVDSSQPYVETHVVQLRIVNTNMFQCGYNQIHLPHDNQSQNNMITIRDCIINATEARVYDTTKGDYVHVHQHSTKSQPASSTNPYGLGNLPVELNTEYGNCMYIAGSGVQIHDCLFETCICCVYTANGYKKGMDIGGLYCENYTCQALVYLGRDWYYADAAGISFRNEGICADSTSCFSLGAPILRWEDKVVDSYKTRTASDIVPYCKDFSVNGQYKYTYLVAPRSMTRLRLEFTSSSRLTEKERIITPVIYDAVQPQYINALYLESPSVGSDQHFVTRSNIDSPAIDAYMSCSYIRQIPTNTYTIYTVDDEPRHDVPSMKYSLYVSCKEGFKFTDEINRLKYELELNGIDYDYSIWAISHGGTLPFQVPRHSEDEIETDRYGNECISLKHQYNSHVNDSRLDAKSCTVYIVAEPKVRHFTLQEEQVDGMYRYSLDVNTSDALTSAILRQRAPIAPAAYAFKLPVKYIQQVDGQDKEAIRYRVTY